MMTTLAHTTLGTVTIETVRTTGGLTVFVAQASRFPECIETGFSIDECVNRIVAYTNLPA